MIAFLDKLYFRFNGDTYKKSLVNRGIAYLIRAFANIYAKYFMLAKKKQGILTDRTIICSLTSYPERIKSVWMTIVTLLNQDYDDMRVVLWLSMNQFDGKNSLPYSLLKLEKKGLLIKFVEDDLRPHKKYYGCLTVYPNNTFITFDDDVLYHPSIVSRLTDVQRKYPGAIVCNRAMKLRWVSNYRAWGQYRPKSPKQAMEESEHLDLIPTGIGGVLYPRGCFKGTQVLNVNAIKQTTLNTDDLWLNFWARYNHVQVLHSGYRYGLITLFNSQQSSLTKFNVAKTMKATNRNDMEKDQLSSWAEKHLGCDFFVNLKNKK